MSDAEGRWRGFNVGVQTDSRTPNVYRVEFWPKELMKERGLNGNPGNLSKPAVVTVEVGQEPHVTYQPSDKTWHDVTQSEITQEHYEEKALEEVRKYQPSNAVPEHSQSS